MKIVIHATSRRSLERARVETARMAELRKEATVRIVATGDGAVAAVREPHNTDILLILCGDSLAAAGMDNPRGIEVTPNGTELVARLQRKDWSYVHG